MSINVVNPDFNSLRISVKEFLKSQTVFSDYNFEGSALSVLIDAWCYEISNVIFYLNMVGAEAFLDSAQLRESVVSRAKALGYTPKSVTSARANLSVTFFPGDNPAGIIIPNGFKFTTNIDDKLYIFSTSQSYYITKNSDYNYHFTGIEIVEGIRLLHRFTVDELNPSQKFILPNVNVDISTIKITVQNSSQDDTIIVYNNAHDILAATSSSKIYFVQEIADNLYEIYFGKNVLGQQPSHGNIIIVEYVVSKGPSANEAVNFIPEYSIDGYSANYTLNSISYGGSEIESIDSIKLNAPVSYQSQNRAVTTIDYEHLIKTHFKFAESVKVWGGESIEPKQYGKVFVSIKPLDGYNLSETAKTYIKSKILEPRSLPSITIEIVDPEYIYIVPSIEINYKSSLSNKSENNIKVIVVNSIENYIDNNLNKFDSGFNFSDFSTMLDNTDVAIQNNVTTINLRKRFFPDYNLIKYYSFRFSNLLSRGDVNNNVHSVTSSSFVYNGYIAYLQDTGKGILQIYRVVEANKIILNSYAGEIDYSTGTLNLINFLISGIPGGANYIDLKVMPKTFNVKSTSNQIITIDQSQDLSIIEMNDLDLL